MFISVSHINVRAFWLETEPDKVNSFGSSLVQVWFGSVWISPKLMDDTQAELCEPTLCSPLIRVFFCMKNEHAKVMYEALRYYYEY